MSPNTGTLTDLASDVTARVGAVSTDARDALSSNTTARLANVLASALTGALGRLAQRIDAVGDAGALNSAAASARPGGPASTSQQGNTASSDIERSAGLNASPETASTTGSGLDPGALTTLAPGTYCLGQQGGATIKVYSGDTWQDVLSRMARAFGSASATMVSQLVPARRAQDSPWGARSAGADQGISADSGKTGWSLAQLPKLADALAEVLDSYNEVTDLLARNRGGVQPDALRHWTSAASERSAGLSSVGVGQTGQSLWLSEQDFLAAALAQPETVQRVLVGAGGLLPTLKAKAESALSALAGGQEPRLSAQSDGTSGQGGLDLLAVPLTARTELEVEKASQLLDLYDTKSDFDLGAAPGAGARTLVSKKG